MDRLLLSRALTRRAVLARGARRASTPLACPRQGGRWSRSRPSLSLHPQLQLQRPLLKPLRLVLLLQ
ncbi:MAG: hypothetical protein ACJ8I3_26855, partial [Paraburkholderia graminis]